VKAGTDQNCGDTYPHLVEAVKQGHITEAEIDVSVKRILLAMMKLGMFDTGVPYAKIPYSVVESPENVALALDAARKSIVLLKNDGLLPLSKDVKKVAVIGPNADDFDVLLANYNGFPTHYKTPLAGIREKLPQAEVLFAQGCELAPGMPYFTPIPAECLFTDDSKTQQGLHAVYASGSSTQSAGRSVAQTDRNIDFIWGQSSPAEGVDGNNFTAAWTGVLIPPASGTYLLSAEAEQLFSFYVDDSLVLDVKSGHNPRKAFNSLTLEAGKTYRVRAEYAQDNTQYSMARLLWAAPNPGMLQQAIDIARQSEVVILCLGLSPSLEGEEMPVLIEGFAGGDRINIGLPSTQKALIAELAKLGKPIALVLLNGSALALEGEAAELPAIVEAWYPGQQGGTAIADVLFGDYNPAGRLPVTFYQSENDIPEFINYDMQGKTYRYFAGTPLYEFGYGLSYSTFEYEITKSPQTITAGEDIKVTAEVTNTGKIDGDEVVQLYVSFPGSSLKAPIRTLQGFKRIHLKAGKRQRVEFTLKPSQIALRDADNVAAVRPGTVQLSIGGKQPDVKAIAAKQVAVRDVTVLEN
jgi:beta-glucosidase